MPRRSAQRAPIVAPAGAAQGLLNVTYVSQEQDNWCWACCEMLFGLVGFTVNENSVRQCEMASAQFNAQCCSAPSSSVCDQGCWPENVYNYYGLGYVKTNSALPPAAVTSGISAGRAVEVYYAWTGGSAHVALIVGYYDNNSIARQVGERLSTATLASVPPGGVLSIGETFAVWMLGLNNTTRSTEDFSRLATNTGNWHHQIHNPSGKHSTCRSTANGPSPED
jgi:Papain-like cysteine protease AvrRpt2